MSQSLVLASASPRRSQLFRDLGIPFLIRPALAPEPLPSSRDGANPAAFVEMSARFKVDDVALRSGDDEIIVAADTIVVLDQEILIKPRNEDEARSMLTSLRERTHRVYTGICVRQGEMVRSAHEITLVTFGNFSNEFIKAYVATGEPMDKAGAYAAQGKGALLVERIDGDYWNVVGLPVYKLMSILVEFGLDVTNFWG